MVKSDGWRAGGAARDVDRAAPGQPVAGGREPSYKNGEQV